MTPDHGFRRHLGYLAIVMTATVAAVSSAALAEIVSLSPGHLRCEMRKGMSGREDISAFAVGGALSGRIRAVADQQDAARASSAGLIFELKGGTSAGIVLKSSPEDPASVTVEMVNIGEKVRVQQPIAKWPRDQWVPMKASIDADGNLNVESGSNAATMNVGSGSVKRRMLQCQSGTFEVDLRN